jgi:hypothetical protein
MVGVKMKLLYGLLCLFTVIQCNQGQRLKFLLVTESAQQELNNKFAEGLKTVQDSSSGTVLELKTINFTRKYADDAYTDLCAMLSSDSFTAIIDMAWGGWIKVKNRKLTEVITLGV